MSGTSWATFDEATGYTEEKNLHIGGTIQRPNGTEFWMFNPPYGKPCRIRCGICKNPMDGYRHCPYCYPEKEEE